MSKREFKNIKVLFVEDDDNIRVNAILYLKKLFDEVYEAQDAMEAFEIIESQRPHIIVTDINMPKINGLEMIREIRQKDENIKIIVLSAYTNTEYLLEAVELRLEKYLIKPISHDTLFLTLTNCVDKISASKKRVYFSSNCYFDLSQSVLYKDSDMLYLTKRELDLLALLCDNSNKLVSYDIIQNVVWQDSFMSDDALRTTVRKLRQKLPENSLENLSKVGYKINSL